MAMKHCNSLSISMSLTLYKFLMRYYTPGDDIYFFGFSRGAYTARFLAEMLDHVGLLSVSYQLADTRLPRTDRNAGW